MQHIKALILKDLWKSATIMTWCSFISSAGSTAIILPLAMVQLDVTEFVFWQLLVLVRSLTLMLDVGIGSTFIRLISYSDSFGIVKIQAQNNVLSENSVVPSSVYSISEIWVTLDKIFNLVSVLGLVICCVFGVFVLGGRVNEMPNRYVTWCLIIISVLTTPLGLKTISFGAMIQGLDHIAEMRRIETFVALIIFGFQIILLNYKAGLCGLVIPVEIGVFLLFYLKKSLFCRLTKGIVKGAPWGEINTNILKTTWPAIWRSGLGIFCSAGYIQATGIMCSRMGEKSLNEISKYLIGLRLISAISQFSQAPFYSKLPRLGRLLASGNQIQVIEDAKRGMRLSYFTFTIAALMIGVFGPIFLDKIGSKIQFPDQSIWWSLVFAFFFERLGAMHIQLFSLTNRIFWHIANGITSIISIVALKMLLENNGIIAFPLSYLFGNAMFYAWFSMYLSHNYYSLGGLKFELQTSVVPFAALIIAAILMIYSK